MTLGPGVCRFCGCSQWDACPGGCAWADHTATVCTTCVPAATAWREAYTTLNQAGYPSDHRGSADALAFSDALRHGFIVGWFGISPLSLFGRNPYHRNLIARAAWDLGLRQGTVRSAQHQAACGPLRHAPRRTVLVPDPRRDRVVQAPRRRSARRRA